VATQPLSSLARHNAGETVVAVKPAVELDWDLAPDFCGFHQQK
jgi:hypothetical protein